MAEENKLNQTPEITPAPSAEAPEKAPTTGELLGDVEHYDEEKDDWSTGYYGTGSRQQVTDDVFHKLETGRYYEKRYALAAFYTLFFWSVVPFFLCVTDLLIALPMQADENGDILI